MLLDLRSRISFNRQSLNFVMCIRVLWFFSKDSFLVSSSRQQQELERLDKSHQQELEMYLSEIHPEIVQAVAGKSGFVGQMGATTWGPCPQPKDVAATQTDLGIPVPQTLPKKVPVKIINDPNDVTPLTDTHMQPLTLPSRAATDETKHAYNPTISPSLDGHSDSNHQSIKGQALDEPRRADSEKQPTAEEVTDEAVSSNLKRSQSLKDHIRQLNRMDTLVSPSSLMVLRRKQSVDAAILAAKESDTAPSAEKEEPVPILPQADKQTLTPLNPEASTPNVSSQNQPTATQAYAATSSVMPGVILSQATGLQSQPRTILAEKSSISQQPRVAVVPLHRASQPALAALQTNDFIDKLHHLFPNFVPGGKPLSAGISSHTGHPLDVGAQMHLAHIPQPGSGATQARAAQMPVHTSGHSGIQPHLVPQSLAAQQVSQMPKVVMSTGVLPAQGHQQVCGSTLAQQPQSQQLAAIASVLQSLQQLGGAVGPGPAAGQLQGAMDGSPSQLMGAMADPQSLAAALCLIQQYSQNPEQLEMLLQQQHQQAPMRQLIQQAASLRGLSTPIPGNIQTGAGQPPVAQPSGVYPAQGQQPTGQGTGQPQLKPVLGSQAVPPSSFPLQQGQGLPGQPSAMLESMIMQSGGMQTPLQGRGPLMTPGIQTSQAQVPQQGQTPMQAAQLLAQIQLLQGQLQSQAQHQAGQAQLQNQLQAGQSPMHTQMLQLQALLADSQAQAGRIPGQVQQPVQGQLQGQTWVAPKATDLTHQVLPDAVQTGSIQSKPVQMPATAGGQQPQMFRTPAASQNGEDAQILQQLLSQKAAIEKYLSQHYQADSGVQPQLQANLEMGQPQQRQSAEQAYGSQLPDHAMAQNFPQTAAPSQGLWGAVQGQAKMPGVEGSLSQRRDGQLAIGLLPQQQQAMGMPASRTLTPMEQSILQTTAMRQAAVGGGQAKDSMGMQLMGGMVPQSQQYAPPFLLDQIQAGQAMDEQLLLMYLLQQQQQQQQQDQQQSLSYADMGQMFPGALQMQSGVIPAHMLASRATPLASQQFVRQGAPPAQQATMVPSSLQSAPVMAPRVAQTPVAGTGESLSQQQPPVGATLPTSHQ